MPKKTAKNDLWLRLTREAKAQQKQEPVLAHFLHASLLDHDNFASALGFVLANKLAEPALDAAAYRAIFAETFHGKSALRDAERDLTAVLDRDPAAQLATQVFLYFKGFHALQTHRAAHFLWNAGRKALAYHLQSRAAETFAVDIHPAAQIGHGIMLDHANGIVIGETTVIGDNVSMLHDVTLGGTGHTRGDRHPKIANGVLLGTGSRVLGNIKLGIDVKVAAGSVVLDDVPAHTTVAGVPAKPIGKAKGVPAISMNQRLKE